MNKKNSRNRMKPDTAETSKILGKDFENIRIEKERIIKEIGVLLYSSYKWVREKQIKDFNSGRMNDDYEFGIEKNNDLNRGGKSNRRKIKGSCRSSG